MLGFYSFIRARRLLRTIFNVLVIFIGFHNFESTRVLTQKIEKENAKEERNVEHLNRK